MRFWNDTVNANDFITKNGRLVMTERLTLSYRMTYDGRTYDRFPLLYGTVNAFLIQNENCKFYWYGMVRTSKIMTKNGQTFSSSTKGFQQTKSIR